MTNVMGGYEQYIHISRYSRFRDDLGRRETWAETVQRYVDYFDKRTQGKYTDLLNGKIKEYIFGMKAMPSMRAMMTAGEALDRDNTAGYNCSYLACNTKRSFSEALHVLMCGTGVGFSCESQYTGQLPVIPKMLTPTQDLIAVADSKKGWAKAYAGLLSHLWNGDIPRVDFSAVRPKGARLKTFGGRASGPEPLKRLFDFTIDMFARHAGSHLRPIDVLDLMCMVAEIVVVGGVRRSALIALTDLNDDLCAKAKSNFKIDQYSLVNETETEWVYTITMKRNQPTRPTYRVVLSKAKQDWVRTMLEMTKTIPWYIVEPQRGLANISTSYESKPTAAQFMKEWLALVESGSGERGIFNREAARKQAGRWKRRSTVVDYGCNPCSEILLLIMQFCNLTEVIARSDDTLETLMEKVEIATILGTLQATLTDFDFINAEWAKNTRADALLGVSITGIYDNELLAGAKGEKVLIDTLETLRLHARQVNEEWAAKLGINAAAAITCVKPSGTVSQLCNTASGIHPRHNRNYIRTVRIDKKDPLYAFMFSKGFHIEDDMMRPDTTAVVSFPISAPANAVLRQDVTSLEALRLWLIYQRHWCEHKPSITVSVKDQDWPEVGAWVYKHFDEISGVSFLPDTDHTYEQAPYQDMTEDEMAAWLVKHPQPEVDWSELAQWEATDNTTGLQTLACTANGCELPGT